MLTEAVCARHQLCCSKEERHAAESGREKNRESSGGKPLVMEEGGKEKWDVHHLPSHTLPS